jgi:hypothetical protein
MGGNGWRWLTIAFVISRLAGVVMGATACLERAESRNGKFRVVIEAEAGSAAELAASMVKVDGRSEVVQWTTTIPYYRTVASQAPPVFVSDRGDFFVRASGFNELTLFRKGPHTTIVTKARRFQPIHYSQFPGVEDVGGEEVLRLWNSSFSRWDAFKTAKGTEYRVTPEDVTRWNEVTRLEIIEKLEAAKLQELRRKAASTWSPLKRLPAFGPTNRVGPTIFDYTFLAMLRKPEDRKWIEELAKNKSGISGWMFRVVRPPAQDHYYFEETDHLRAQGDWLLGYWDQKVSHPMPRWNVAGDAPRFSLGKVEGAVRLPMPMPIYRNATQATRLHIRLIPERGQKEIEEERIEGVIGFERAVNRKRVYDVRFAFTTVLPGTYRLKAVWDKRAPLSDTNSAGPGDYESGMTAPFLVEAGKVFTNAVLNCTNRVKGGETYYSADAALAAWWVADNPPAPEKTQGP